MVVVVVVVLVVYYTRCPAAVVLSMDLDNYFAYVFAGDVALISAALDFDAAVADIRVDLGLGAVIVVDVFTSLSIALLYPDCIA